MTSNLSHRTLSPPIMGCSSYVPLVRVQCRSPGDSRASSREQPRRAHTLTLTEFANDQTLVNHSLSHSLEMSHHGVLGEGRIRKEY